jgi:hypothetical protein
MTLGMTAVEEAVFNAIAAASHAKANSGEDLTDEECEEIERLVREKFVEG